MKTETMMKNQLQAMIASTAVAVLSGCASGGGGGGSDNAEDALKCLIAGPLCVLLHAQPSPSNPASASSSSSTPTPAAFTSWKELSRDSLTPASGLAAMVLYETKRDSSGAPSIGAVSEVVSP